MKKISFLILILLTIIQIGFSSEIFNCKIEYSSETCENDEETLFYTNKNILDLNGYVINSPIDLFKSNPNYNRPVCCKVTTPPGINIENIKFEVRNSTEECPEDSNDFLYYTNSTNSKVWYKDSTLFNPNYYSHKTCITFSDKFSTIDIIVSNIDYSKFGYTCLFKSNELENSKVSDCNAEISTGNQYKFTTWIKLWENLNTLECDSSCTSKLDGRVYYACSKKISNCENVPIECDGALLDSWVETSEGSKEVKCSSPWDQTRDKQITSENLKVFSSKNKCSNLINKQYSVLVNNELVTMNVYICSN